MATIVNVYQGDLRTSARHVRSGEMVLTDAPVDNQGKGEKFSPTDLLTAALGACMLTIMGIKARDSGIDINGSEIDTTKVMASDPRRVGEIQLRFKMRASGLSDKQKKILEKSALTCPVALSLHPDLVQNVVFIWE